MLNKVMLIGHLGADPELRYTQSGAAVVLLRLASTERWKGPDGRPQEHTEWHRIVAWAGLAEICHQYLHKGSRIYVEGKLRTNKWQDQAGADRYSTEIVKVLHLESDTCNRTAETSHCVGNLGTGTNYRGTRL